MNNIYLEEKYVLEYIKDMLNSFKINAKDINDEKYHHNTSYLDAPLLIKHGILTLSSLSKLGIKKYSKETLNIFSDINSHVNGIDAVSLSVVGLTDIYPNEDEYDPYFPTLVDFIITKDIKVGRSTQHYGNEYLCYGDISIDKFKSIDIRLLELIDKMNKISNLEQVINKYNCIKDMAIAMKQSNLDIPFRDMSNNNLTLDIDKVSKTPKILLK